MSYYVLIFKIVPGCSKCNSRISYHDWHYFFLCFFFSIFSGIFLHISQVTTREAD